MHTRRLQRRDFSDPAKDPTIGTAETMENTTTDPTMQANHAGCSAEMI